MARRKSELFLSEAEEKQLTSIARSRSISAALSQRARIVLTCAAGHSNSAAARQLALNTSTVGKWRARFVRQRLSGLYDELRPGRPRTIDDERVAGLIRKTLHQSPRTARRTEAYVALPGRAASPRPACTATCSCLASSPIAPRASSFPPTRSSSRSCVMSWAFT